MKVPEEILALSRHLMLFLVAVFAFVSKTFADGVDLRVRYGYIASVLFAFASFVVGYGTMFHVFRHFAKAEHASTLEAPPEIIKSLKVQYRLTMYSLALLIVAIVIFVLGSTGAPGG